MGHAASLNSEENGLAATSLSLSFSAPGKILGWPIQALFWLEWGSAIPNGLLSSVLNPLRMLQQNVLIRHPGDIIGDHPRHALAADLRLVSRR